ncbi:Holliday junction branch migration protein RuvA [Shimia sp. R11_0]|uniref:Holliday junction branch migration protein RuvA n=1 Tax=Shimia sp. R11_0 TaxID=2821096 RepID=UPI001ADCF556|nr:Holliday junction branch migration protein RuvA [Shimia sp. R11_0]MBO9478466.1 Holliday junction branch migration protein RuvA [Shimia sp. R11_0]
MIGKISGRLEYKTADHALIDVRGVGYIVYCSERTLAGLPAVGEAVALYTDLLVREDLLQLYGFASLFEKEWHRLLMSVQGIGAKASLAILSALGAEGVSRAITLGDVAAIKVAKGVGPKTAQRVVIELKDKAPEVMALGGSLSAAMAGASDVAPEVEDAAAPGSDEVIEEPARAPVMPSGASAASGAAAAASMSVQADALSALGNLGYGPADAATAVAQAASDTPGADTAALIRAALKLLAPKG